MNKTLYILIGPKGSGKTHIGTLVSQCTDISFLRVEPIWLSCQPGEDGWKKVEAAIDMAFRAYNKLMIESLGIGEEFRAYRDALEKKYTLKLIRVSASPEVCLDRVKNRNNAEHIPVSDERVEGLNQLASTVSMDWDLEIDNDRFVSDSDILAALQSVLSEA